MIELIGDNLLNLLISLKLSDANISHKIQIHPKITPSKSRCVALNLKSLQYLNLPTILFHPYREMIVGTNKNPMEFCINAHDFQLKLLGGIATTEHIYHFLESQLKNIESEKLKYSSEKMIKIASSSFFKPSSGVVQLGDAIELDVSTDEEWSETAFQLFSWPDILGFIPISLKKHQLIWSSAQGWSTRNLSINNLQEKLSILLKKTIMAGATINSTSTPSPLFSYHASQYLLNDILVLGDAAHGFHPLAGQGLNHGIRDCDELIKILISNHKIDSFYLSKKLEAGCYLPNQLMKNSCEIMSKKIFSNLGSIPFKAFEKSAWIKKIILSIAEHQSWMSCDDSFKL